MNSTQTPWHEAMAASRARQEAKPWTVREAESGPYHYWLIITEHDTIRVDREDDARRIVAAVNGEARS